MEDVVNMKIVIPTSILALLLGSCAALPDMFKDVDNIATDTAIKVEVSREAIQKDTDVTVSVGISNKDDIKKKS